MSLDSLVTAPTVNVNPVPPLHSSGIPGPPGPQGPPGADSTVPGPMGPAGPQGATGPMGPIGPTGLQGATGPAGTPGLMGEQGPPGATGAVGPQGPIGPTGATGPQGIKGDTGATGSQGPKGDTGSQGIQGPQGTAGAPGQGVPVGGGTGQVLTKINATDYNSNWQTPATGLALPLAQTLTFSPDNSFDIGATAASRPRTVYAGTSFIGPGAVPTAGTAGQVLGKNAATNWDLTWITPFTQTLADARYQTPAQAAALYLPLAGGTLAGNLLFSTDNTRDIGASGATRPRDFFLGRNALVGGTLGVTGATTLGTLSAGAATMTSTLLLAADPTLALQAATKQYADTKLTQAQGDARYQTPAQAAALYLPLAGGTLTGNLLFSTDNTRDIGAAGATRPRDLFLARNLNVAGVATHPDLGADTPSLINSGMTAFGGRINIGGIGGADRIGWMCTGINTPNTTLMNGSTQTLWYAEYWSNDANTGALNGMDFGCIGPPTVKVSEINLMRLRGVGARTQKPDYARGLKVESIDNGLVANFGIDIAAPGSSAGLNYGLNVNGKTWLHGVVEIGTDGTLANRPYIRPPAAAPQSLSVESPKGYAFMSAKGGSHLAGNAYWDGTNWMRYDVAAGAARVIAAADIKMHIAAAGANPISAWTDALIVETNGNVTIPAAITLGGVGIQAIAGSTGFQINSNLMGMYGDCNFQRLGANSMQFNGYFTVSSGVINLGPQPGAGVNAASVNMVFYLPPGGTGGFHFQQAGGAGYAVAYASAFTPASARKFKTDILTLTDPLGVVQDERVHGVSYTEIATGDRQVGFVADDWLAVLPEVVALDDLGDVMALDYDRISAVTFEALKQYIARTESRLAALESRT